MAIAMVDTASSAPGGVQDADSVTWSHTVSGTNRLLLVGMGILGNPTTGVGATYNGVTMDAVGTIQHFQSNFAAIAVFALVNPDLGTHDVVATATGNSCVGGGAISLTGVHQSTPLGTPGENTGGADPVQVTGVVSAADEWVVDVAGCSYTTGAALTADASQTERWQTYFSHTSDGNQVRRRIGMSTKPGAASVTMQWTGQNGDGWGIIAVPVKPAAATSVTWLRHRA